MKKIFVVDDDESIGDVVSQMLEMEGFEVHSFLRAKDSIAQLKQEEPDLVLLDYFLPGESAADTIYNIKTKRSDTPIVLMSASVQAANHAKSLPVSEFVSKPFQREVLIEAVRRNLN